MSRNWVKGRIIVLLCALMLLSACVVINNQSSPKSLLDKAIPIKVVIVTMFEIGEDSGDKPGEFQLWKAGQQLHKCLPFPVSHHDICFNPKTGVLGIVTGMGIAKASSAVMALGLDPRFDLRNAYWLVAGIAGFDPADASIGSAAWATWLVDGDLSHEIDAREIPDHWQTGYFPMFSNEPVSAQLLSPAIKDHAANGEVFKLNAGLSEWAYQLTKDLNLSDYPAMQTLREKYVGYPNAKRKPFVLKGDHLAASTFWHGSLLTEWANDWTRYWTSGRGNFVSSGMEDTGAYQSMIYLDNAGKADKNRFMVLRTGSNYSMPPPGLSADENLALESGEEGYAGMLSSIESAYTVGSTVVNSIVKNWSVYKDQIPDAVIAQSNN